MRHGSSTSRGVGENHSIQYALATTPYDYQLAARSRGPAHLRKRRSARRDASNERAQRGACVAVQLEGRCRLLSGFLRAGAGGGERLNVGEHLVQGVRGRVLG